jgi:hypothetical protein
MEEDRANTARIARFVRGFGDAAPGTPLVANATQSFFIPRPWEYTPSLL